VTARPRAPSLRDNPYAGAPLAIVCGGGDLPTLFAEAAVAVGRAPFLVGVVGSADARIERFPHLWLKLGEMGKFIDALAQRGIVDVAAVGPIKRPEFSEIRFDFGALKRLPGLAALFVGGDNHLLAGVARLLEKEGLKLVAVQDVAPQLLAGEGALTRRSPSDQSLSDARLGAGLIAALSPYDVGQAVVIARGRAIAVEAAEGTDGMLARVADMRASGRLAFKGRAGLLFKAPKRGQEMRLDAPAIGKATIEAAVRAELEGVVVAAGQVLVVDQAACADVAERAGLFLYGMRL
jgi:UDP-2,3-diacylglucosamine hydrolase